MTKKISEKGFAIILCLIYLIEVFPLFTIAKYNFPSVDDFSFGAEAKEIWHSSQDIFEILQMALRSAYETYYSWQGLYTTNFLLHIQPASFGENFYAIVPIVIICFLTASTVFLVWTVFHKIFSASGRQIICLSIILLTLNFQFLPSAVQGFYWYTSVTAYTFVYCLSLFLYGLLVLFCYSGRKGKYAISAALCILSFWIGGGATFPQC